MNRAATRTRRPPEPDATWSTDEYRASRAAAFLAAAGRVLLGGVSMVVFVLGVATVGAIPMITLTLVLMVVVKVLRSPVDGVTAVGFLVVVLLLWPSGLRVAGLGAMGAPVVILGACAGALWALGFLAGRPWASRHPPWLLAVMALFVGSIIVSYIAACLRVDLDLQELAAADRTAVSLLASVAVALVVASAARSQDAVEALVRILVLACAGTAALAMWQFFTGVDLVARIMLPGFEAFVSDWDAGRSGFTRVFATAAHPIEYSVVLAMVLPLSLHVAFGATGRGRLMWWACVALIGGTLPMTVSRTAVLAVAAVIIVMLPFWSGARRRIVLIAGGVGVIVMQALVPGLLGTIRALFTSAAEDPSVTARTEDYEVVLEYVTASPAFGRGYGTFLPSRYTFLDNEFLMTAVTGGLLGVLAFALLFLVPMYQARRLSASAPDAEQRDLARSLLAGLLASFLTGATFDLFSFSTVRVLTFVLIGLVAALASLSAHASPSTMSVERGPRRSIPSPSAAHNSGR